MLISTAEVRRAAPQKLKSGTTCDPTITSLDAYVYRSPLLSLSTCLSSNKENIHFFSLSPQLIQLWKSSIAQPACFLDLWLQKQGFLSFTFSIFSSQHLTRCYYMMLSRSTTVCLFFSLSIFLSLIELSFCFLLSPCFNLQKRHSVLWSNIWHSIPESGDLKESREFAFLKNRFWLGEHSWKT